MVSKAISKAISKATSKVFSKVIMKVVQNTNFKLLCYFWEKMKIINTLSLFNIF